MRSAAECLAAWCTQHPAPITRPTSALVDLAASGLLDPPGFPLPAAGRTAEAALEAERASRPTMERFEALATVASHDVALGRLVEGHVDAIGILAEAGALHSCQAPVWKGAALGVWAGGPPGDVRTSRARDGSMRLQGTRRWCSGAGTLTHALVTAVTGSARPDPDVRPCLFLVDLSSDRVFIDQTSWPAVGMSRTDTFDVTFDGLLLEPGSLIGKPGWYGARAGFWQGGTGVAACWWGAARGVADALRASDDLYLRAAHGLVGAQLWAMQCALSTCAESFDADPFDKRNLAARQAQLTRLLVEQRSAEVLRLVGEATGAGPLCRDSGHAHRVADLTVYLRQHHGLRDAAQLAAALDSEGWPG
ncbi:MAG: acyl-CoA dehydrogenase [Acidimicrobiales bacterium]